MSILGEVGDEIVLPKAVYPQRVAGVSEATVDEQGPAFRLLIPPELPRSGIQNQSQVPIRIEDIDPVDLDQSGQGVLVLIVNQDH